MELDKNSNENDMQRQAIIRLGLLFFVGAAMIFGAWYLTLDKSDMDSKVFALLDVFAGAGVLVVLTAIIMVFQHFIYMKQQTLIQEISMKQEILMQEKANEMSKKEEVYRNKMKLYSDIIENLDVIISDGIITNEEKNKMMAMLQKVLLLSGKETVKAFQTLIKNINELTRDDKISENEQMKFHEFVNDFIREARDDLEVQESIDEFTAQEKDELKEIQTTLRTPYQKNYFDNIEEYITEMDYSKHPDAETFLRYFHDALFNKKDSNIEFLYSKTLISIKKNGINHLGIKPTKKLGIDLEEATKNAGGLSFLNNKMKLIPADNSKYNKVRFKDSKEFDICKDAIIEHMNSKST